jgi:hypothetical protein
MKLHEPPDTAEFRDFKKVLFAWAAERNDRAEAMWDDCFAIADRRDATQNLDRVGTARAAVDLISNSWKRSGWPPEPATWPVTHGAATGLGVVRDLIARLFGRK